MKKSESRGTKTTLLTTLNRRTWHVGSAILTAISLAGCAESADESILQNTPTYDSAAIVVAEMFGAGIHILDSNMMPTTDGRSVTVVLCGIGGATSPELWVQERRDVFDQILSKLAVIDVETLSEIEALEHSSGEGSTFASAIVGADGSILSVQSGLPMAVGLSSDQLQRLGDILGVDACGAVVDEREAAVIVKCGDTVIGKSFSQYLHDRFNIASSTEPADSKAPEPHKVGQLPPSIANIAMQFPLGGTGWYHYPGSAYHYPNSGFYGADDTYALDLNLAAGDSGKPVYAAAGGTVKQSSNGWVLIEHNASTTWAGRSYTKFYSGYGHMSNVLVAAGATVSKGAQLGSVSNVACSGCGTHLHFGLYVGKYLSTSNNHLLYSVNPASQNSVFANFDYVGTGKIKDQYVDESLSSGSYIFARSGDSADWLSTSSYGVLGNMLYTKASIGGNTATWTFNDGAPGAGTYRVYAFIPANYATSVAAPYKVYGGSLGSTLKLSTTVNQYNYSDYWYSLGAVPFGNLDRVVVSLSDATGETTTKYVGVDVVRRWQKSDGYLYQ